MSDQTKLREALLQQGGQKEFFGDMETICEEGKPEWVRSVLIHEFQALRNLACEASGLSQEFRKNNPKVSKYLSPVILHLTPAKTQQIEGMNLQPQSLVSVVESSLYQSLHERVKVTRALELQHFWDIMRELKKTAQFFAMPSPCYIILALIGLIGAQAGRRSASH